MGFASIADPNILGLLPGAKPLQTIWSDTEVHYTVGTAGTVIVVEKVVPGGTLNVGAVVQFRYEGLALVQSGLALQFWWGGTGMVILPFITGTSPFYMDIAIAQALPTAQTVIARCGNTTSPILLTIVGSFANASQDITASFRAVQATDQDGIQLALAHAILLSTATVE